MVEPTLGLGLILIILVALVYIITLVKQASKKQWGWFVLTLFVPPVWIIYWIIQLFSKN